jgi:hypothetical protein
LIDLNGDKTNFDLNFHVASKDKIPFEALVVSQENLDSGDELKYKHVSEGLISGNIIADKGVYQNYFLLLKSEEPLECEINVQIKDVPLNPEIQKLQMSKLNQQPENKPILHEIKDDKNNVDENFFNIRNIIIIVIIIAICLFIYFYFLKKPDDTQILTLPEIQKSVSTSLPLNNIDMGDLDIPSVPVHSIPVSTPVSSFPDIQTSNNFNMNSKHNDLVSRLNNLQMW